jgi:hypothetical protein
MAIKIYPKVFGLAIKAQKSGAEEMALEPKLVKKNFTT